MPPPPTSQKTFILGLGAQKAGTSWLYDYLAASGLVATQIIKEYHIWDALHVQGVDGLIVRKEDSELDFENRVRYFMQQSPENYFTYFAYMLNKQAKSITCDITPLYSALDRRVLDQIQRGFAQRSILTKAVFLMRDPVERCWSAARMDSRNKLGHTRVDEDEVIARALSGMSELRTRYDVTVQEAEAVFQPGHIHFGIYEDMFDPEPLGKLSEFCRVPFRPSHTQKKLNVSEITAPLSDAVYEKIARHYRQIYRFAERRFPQTTTLWRGFKYL